MLLPIILSLYLFHVFLVHQHSQYNSGFCTKLLIAKGNDVVIHKIANDHEKDEKYK